MDFWMKIKKLIKQVKADDLEKYKYLCAQNSQNGTGGMFSKLKAAADAIMGGVNNVAIAGIDSN